MLTIISVNYNASLYLNANIEHLSRRDFLPKEFKWFVVDNSEEPDDLDARFNILPGVQSKGYDPDAHRIIWGGSIPHSLGLNSALSTIDFSSCQYLLVMDPDFYLLKPIDDILSEMSSKQLGFAGADYTNLKKNLIRGFPTAFCMFVDLHQVPLKDLDFRAGFESKEEMNHYGVFKDNGANKPCLWPDTGWRISSKYKDGPLKYKVIANKPYQRLNGCDWYPQFAVHARMKVEKKKRDKLTDDRLFLKKLLKGGEEFSEIGL